MFTVPTFLKGPAGSLLLNSLIDGVKGGFMIPSSAQQGITVPAAGVAGQNGQSAPVIVECPTDSWAEVVSLIGALTGATSDVTDRMLATIFDLTSNTLERKLMNRPINLNHIFGTAQNQFYLQPYSETMLFQDQQTMTFVFENPSTAGDGTVSFNMPCVQYLTQARKDKSIAAYLAEGLKRKRQISPYWFAPEQDITFQQPGVTLPASQGRDLFYRNVIPGDLILTAVMVKAISSGAAGDTNEKVKLQIYDARTEKPFQNQPISLNSCGGDAAFPHQLPIPIVLKGENSILRVSATNLVTDANTDVIVTFFGAAVYNEGY